MSAKQMAILAGVGVLALILLIGAVLAYHQVPEGNEGVTKSWGSVTGETLGPGAHFKVPVMQDVQDVEIRPRTYTMSATQGEGNRDDADAISVLSVNGTSVNVDITVRYRINQSQADTFVKVWNNEEQMEQRLIRPTIRSDLRDEASDIQTSDIYTEQGRTSLTETARASLKTEFSDEPIVLEEVQIRNIDLPQSIDERLDEKEEAKQQVQIEQEEIKQERARAEQQRVQAQAESDVIDIRGSALRENRVVLEARMIEAYDEGTVFVTSGNEDVIIPMPDNSSGNGMGPEPSDG